MHNGKPLHNKRGPDGNSAGSVKALVDLMERFPVDRRNAQLAPLEREPIKFYTRELKLEFPGPQAAGIGHFRGHLGGRCAVDMRGKEQPQSSSSLVCLEMKRRIKAGTMRHVRTMIAQQVSRCRAEAELLRRTEDKNEGERDFLSRSPRQQGVTTQEIFGEENVPDSTAVSLLATRDAEQDTNAAVDDKSETKYEKKKTRAMAADNRNPTFVFSGNDGARHLPSRFLPLLCSLRRRGEWQSWYLRDTPFSRLLERRRRLEATNTENSGFLNLNALCGRGIFQESFPRGGKDSYIGKNAHSSVLDFFRKHFFLRMCPPPAAEKIFDFSSVTVRRLAGVPNHDRGLYANLRQEWSRDSKAKSFARRLRKGRVQPSSWWMLAESREGMVAAAKALGLDPVVYENLVTPWMWNKKLPKRRVKSTKSFEPGVSDPLQTTAGSDLFGYEEKGEENRAVTDVTLAHALQSAFAGSPLYSGDEEIAKMQRIAQQLGQLRMKNLISAEELACILDAGDERAQNELSRLLELDAVSQTSVPPHMSSSEMVMAIARERAESLRELANNILQEKRRAAVPKMSDECPENATGQSENSAVLIGDSTDSLMQAGKYKIMEIKKKILRKAEKRVAEDSQTLPSINIAQHHTELGAERKFYGEMHESALYERAALQEEEEEEEGGERQAAKQEGKINDYFVNLPGLRGLDEGQALRHGSRLSRSRSDDRAQLYDNRRISASHELCFSDNVEPSLSITLDPATAMERAGELALMSHDADGYSNEVSVNEWWKKKSRQPSYYHPKSDVSFDEEEDNGEGENNASQRQQKQSRSDKAYFISRRRRRHGNKQSKQDVLSVGSTEKSSEKSSQTEREPSLSSQFTDILTENAVTRDRHKKGSTVIPVGAQRKRLEVTVSGADGGRAIRKVISIPKFTKKSKPSSVISVAKTAGFVNELDETDDKELSSLFADDDDDLNLFLATFPEEEVHVRLRHEAKGFLGNLDEEGSAIINYATNARQRVRGQFAMKAERVTPASPPVGKKAEQEVSKLKVNSEELRHRFEMEARERNAELWQTLQELRQKVLDQENFLRQADMDVINLSRPAPGEGRDAFALHLTEEVNKYARTYRIDPKFLTETFDTKKNYAAAVQAFLSSFAITRGRRPGRDVGCQCYPEDLGYVDEDIKRIQEEMEDLYFHARGLLNAIKLTTVAVGNVMAFHAALELESTCKYCFCIFENPRTLWPCGHTFCQQCLAFMFADNGELICDECGSLCEVGYTPNFALELLASYQIMQRSDSYDNEDEEEEFYFNVQRRTIEGVLATLLRDLMATQLSIADAKRASISRPPSRQAFTAEIGRSEPVM